VGALPLVPPHQLVDVVGHDRDQGGVVEVAVGDPAGQLRVPHEGVAADLLAVLRGPVDVLVGGAKVELAAAGLGGVPLLRVLGRDGAELALDDVLLLCVAAHRQGRADVPAPRGHHGGVEGLDLALEEPRQLLVTVLLVEAMITGKTHSTASWSVGRGLAATKPLRARATEAENRILKIDNKV